MRFCALLLLLLGVIAASLYAAPAASSATAAPDVSPTRHSLSRDLGHRGNTSPTENNEPEAADTANRQAKAGHLAFRFYDTEVRLLDDHDGDGFNSRFEVGFDADIDGGSAQVYARLYLTTPGGQRIRYHTTDRFWLHGDSQFDRYWVTTELASGYPPGYYQLDLALYNVFDELVAVTDGSDSTALIDLPLEDAFEDHLVNTGLVVDSLTAALEGDADGDGYYHHLRLGFGARLLTPDQGIERTITVRVAMQLIAGGPWQSLTESTPMVIHADHRRSQTLQLELNSSYPAGYYRLRMDFIDLSSGRLMVSLDDSHQVLSGLPLEDSSRDQRRPVVPVAHSTEHGGSLGWAWLLPTLVLWRRLANMRR